MSIKMNRSKRPKSRVPCLPEEPRVALKLQEIVADWSVCNIRRNKETERR